VGKSNCGGINLVVWRSGDEGVDGEAKGESGKIVGTGDRRSGKIGDRELGRDSVPGSMTACNCWWIGMCNCGD
jgi:hypothetical protein